jgi:glycosyltransferase involved in cell wall biosynthesis
MNEADERYKRNLDSILQQEYTNYKVYYVIDLSTDKTAELVEKYIKDRKIEDKIKLYENT